MKAFQLHEDTGDADANKQTDELHAFLHPLCNGDTPHDFEGSNSGLIIWLNVSVGDTIVLGDSGVRVLEKDKPVIITKEAFPNVFEAFLAVEHDNGAHHVNRIAAQEGSGLAKIDLTRFEMPYSYGVDKLVRAEVAIQMFVRLRGATIEDFACSEQTDMEELIRVLAPKIPDLKIAHDLLNDWFNAWETA